MNNMVTGTLTCHATTLANIDTYLGFKPSRVEVFNPLSNTKLIWTDDMPSASAFKDCDLCPGLLKSPGLAMGTDKDKVASLAFNFRIAGVNYLKAAVAAGTALTATTVPDHKWALFGWEIGADGTIDKVDAAGNATGYATEALAIAAAPAANASHIRLGYMTIKTEGATFVGATTLLDAATVEAKNFYNYPLATNPLTLGITPLDSRTLGQGFRVGIDTDLQVKGNTLYYTAWRGI